MNNLLIAFPEKTEAERIRIAKDFYHQLIDTFIETIISARLDTSYISFIFIRDIPQLYKINV